MRVPVILQVYTSPLVLAAGYGRFWAVAVALGKDENSNGSVFLLFDCVMCVHLQGTDQKVCSREGTPHALLPAAPAPGTCREEWRTT